MKKGASPSPINLPSVELRTVAVAALLTEDDVAALLGISAYTLKNDRSRGKIIIPYVKIGRLVRYRIEDVQSFIEENRKVPMEVG